MKIKSIPSVILYEFNQQIKGLNTEYQHYIKNVLNHAGNRANFRFSNHQRKSSYYKN